MIRALTEAEAEHAACLIRTAFANLSIDPPPSAAQVTADAIRLHLTTGGGAFHGSDGVVLWQEKEGGLYLSRLAVRAQARGRGVGMALLAHGEATARAMGLPRVHLAVRLALADNRRLFRRAGFIEGAQHHHPGFAEPTFVDVEKTLMPMQ